MLYMIAAPLELPNKPKKFNAILLLYKETFNIFAL